MLTKASNIYMYKRYTANPMYVPRLWISRTKGRKEGRKEGRQGRNAGRTSKMDERKECEGRKTMKEGGRKEGW
jgi:hypothetical protein